MSWQVSTNGRSFKKYKSSLYKQLIKKKVASEKIDNDFALKEKEGVDLLSKCIDPKLNEIPKDLSTGLAIGLVQSGKTSSIELLANLARDNGFRVIIIMSGLVGTLTKQTQERLYQSMNGIQWKRIYIPGQNDDRLTERDTTEIINSLKTWDEEIYDDDEKRTVVIITMKNVPRLKKLGRLLNKLKENINLDDVPSLIIDDECDHASLDNRRGRRNTDDNESDEDEILQAREFANWDRENDTFDDFLEKYGLQENEVLGLNDVEDIEDLPIDSAIRIDRASSATHKRIKLLRKYLPFSSYIGYTATPYANLLINTWTNLSPKFAQILSPGEGYQGSDFFFNKFEDEYILPIYRKDLVDIGHGLNVYSLQLALRIFILGVAYGILKEEHLSNSARSMFVHTASQVLYDTGGYESHESIVEHLNEDLKILKNRARETRNQITSKEFLETEFSDAYNNITKKTDKESFLLLNENYHNVIEKALNFIEVIPFNASSQAGGSIPIIKWYEEGYARILVGGHGLDRGYTVEGLTVSYLFRRPSKNLDTTLQRARFFGYHSKNLNLFRIFLPDNSNTFFKSAAKTEKYLREHLIKYLKEGKKLVQWPRIFIANSNTDFDLTSSRKIDFNIIRSSKYIQNSYDAKMHLISNEGLRKNRELLSELRDQSEPLININSPRTYLNNDFMKDHRVVLGKTLSQIKEYFSDEERFSEDGAFIFGIINHFIDENYTSIQRDTMECPIIIMNDKIPNTGKPMRRSINYENQTIVIQSNRSGQPYDKDAFVHWDYLMNEGFISDNFAENTPTLQIYNYQVHENSIKSDNFIPDVPYFYFYAPKSWFKEMSLHIGDDR